MLIYSYDTAMKHEIDKYNSKEQADPFSYSSLILGLIHIKSNQ